MVRESLDLEGLRGPEEALDVLPVDLDLAVVHEVQQTPQVVLGHVAEDDDRVLARVVLNRAR